MKTELYEFLNLSLSLSLSLAIDRIPCVENAITISSLKTLTTRLSTYREVASRELGQFGRAEFPKKTAPVHATISI